MTDYRFIVNLKPLSCLETFQAAIHPWGYLLAPDKATPALRKLAQSTCDNQRKLFADNGNFAFIKKIAELYKSAANRLVAKVRKEEKRLGHNLRSEEVDQNLKKQFTSLARKVREKVKEVSVNGEKYFDTQLKLAPTHMIGVEDITMAVWLALNLEPAYLTLERDDYSQLNAGVASLAVARSKNISLQYGINYYPVASAVSYDTAYDAGIQFAKAKLRKIAMGFGAYMADNNYGDHFYIGAQRIDLPLSVPSRYVRTILVTRGFCDGYHKQSGHFPEAFHFLGLGTPIMIGLVSLASWGIRELTFDATSPIKDAVGGTLYTSLPSFLKISTLKISYNLAAKPQSKWDCPCPFCRRFLKNYPFNYKKGNQWLAKSGKARVDEDDLLPKGELFAAFPLMSEPRAGALRKAVDEARIGHNHWMLEEITKKLRENSAGKKQLISYISGVVSKYEESAKNDCFAKAVRLSYNIATATLGSDIKAADVLKNVK